MHKVEQNYTHTHTHTHTHTKPTNCPKFKCNTFSVSFSVCRCNSVVLSSKVGRKRKKKESGDSSENGICGCGLPACCFQPVLLVALFMQISGVSLALTWPHRLCLLRVLLCGSLCYKLSPFQAHWERWHCTHILRPVCLFTVHVGGGCSPLSCVVFLLPPFSQAFLLLVTGQCCCSCQPPCLFTAHVRSGSSLLSCGVFLPPPLSQAFPLLDAGHAPPLLPEPLLLTWLVYLQFWEGFPSPNLRHSVCPTLFPVCLYCSYFLLVSFSFFPGWRSVCPGGYFALAQACLWEYCGTMKLTRSASSQAVFAQATGGPGALLVSPFNVKWRFSALAGGVEGSKLCLFSVIMPAKYVCSVSPRFHYRRLAFCFLPLAAILESQESAL
jgi:hypothetical protein